MTLLSFFVFIIFISSPVISGDFMLIEHNHKIIGGIDSKRFNNNAIGFLDVEGLFDLIRLHLEKQNYSILSRHFNLYCIGRTITRESPNLNALKNIQSKYVMKIDIVYPQYIFQGSKPYVYCFQDKLLTTFKSGTSFELEFNFRLLPVLSRGAVDKYPLFFLESPSMKLTVWIDSWRRLEIVHFYSGSENRGRRRWEIIMTMELTYPLASSGISHEPDPMDIGHSDISGEIEGQRTFETLKATFGHFYIQIGNATSPNLVTLQVNDDLKIYEAEHEIFHQGEEVKIWLFKATHVIQGVIRDVAMHAM